MPPSTDELIELWEQAYEQQFGLCITTDDRRLLQQQLYRARATQGDDRLAGLAVVVPDRDGELWIVHKDANEQIRK